jgi:3-hydroxy acid dehydrogenase/malonic semialdehyde reductase
MQRENMKHTVLVVGATVGFGEATVRRFLTHGYQVIALGKNAEHLEKLQHSISADQHQQLLTMVVDLENSEAIDVLAAALPAAFADVTILVNNVSLDLGADAATHWEQIIERNIKGLAHMTRAILPGMVERQQGHVINLGAVATSVQSLALAGINLDGGTRAFLKQFSLNLRADLSGSPIRVTCIQPTKNNGAQVLEATDVAEAIYWVTHLPKHFNVNLIELMPAQ